MLSQLFDFDDPIALEWNPLLKELDPLLRLGRAKGLAHAPGFPVMPGFWHWVRENESTAPTITPITGPDGESFREPSSGVLEDLRRSDLQDPRVFAVLLAQREESERAAEREIEEAREERQTDMWDHWLAASRTQISMNSASPWSQNHSGRRGARKR